jgi:alkaline phosphatase
LGGWFWIAILALAILAGPATGTALAAAKARNLILFVNDGMQLACEVAASRYLRGVDKGLSWHALPYQGYCATWDVTTYNNYARQRGVAPYDPASFDPRVGYDPSLGGMIPYPDGQPADDRYFLTPGKPYATDSASSATALSTGRKTDDGRLAWPPAGQPQQPLTTIAEELRARQGKAIGVVTTVPFNHATPSAFVAHNLSRENYAAIASEILTRTQPEVVIGGGHPDWEKKFKVDPGMIESARADYTVVVRTPGQDGNQALAQAATGAARLLGIFGGKGGNFDFAQVADSPGSPQVMRGDSENPDLATASTAALTVLARDPDGFFLLVEQGDIDWANHANNFRNMIGSVTDAERAVAAIVAWVDQPGDDIDWSNTLLIVTADHANSYLRLVRPLGPGQLPAQEPGGRNAYGAATFKYPGGEVSYGATNHTNELVTIYAIGAGSDIFRQYEGRLWPDTRIVDNTQLNAVMRVATGLE